jgi:hypothetical protein
MENGSSFSDGKMTEAQWIKVFTSMNKNQSLQWKVAVASRSARSTGEHVQMLK